MAEEEKKGHMTQDHAFRKPVPEKEVEMRERMAVVETRLDSIDKRLFGMDTRMGQIESDLRDLGKKLDKHFILAWVGIIGLALIMAKVFGWIH